MSRLMAITHTSLSLIPLWLPLKFILPFLFCLLLLLTLSPCEPTVTLAKGLCGLVNQDIYFLPQVCELGETLDELYLNENLIAAIPSEIERLKNLNKLYLIGNRLSFVPVELTRLKFIELLYLNKNMITSLPDIVDGGWKKLMFLELSENNLTGIPDAIQSLPNLKELKVDLEIDEKKTKKQY